MILILLIPMIDVDMYQMKSGNSLDTRIPMKLEKKLYVSFTLNKMVRSLMPIFVIKFYV